MRTDMLWSGWGDPAEAITLPDGMLDLLRSALGVRSPTPPVRAADVRLPESSVRLLACALERGSRRGERPH